MADVKIIKVDTQQGWGTIRVAWHHTVIWTYLVGAEGISHIWFGGSWVIDMMIIAGLFTIGAGQIAKSSGTTVSLTLPEIRLWVAAGMPLDVKAWKDARKLHEVA